MTLVSTDVSIPRNFGSFTSVVCGKKISLYCEKQTPRILFHINNSVYRFWNNLVWNIDTCSLSNLSEMLEYNINIIKTMKTHKFRVEIAFCIVTMVKYRTLQCAANEVKLLQAREKQETSIVC
jgi:hypothetical protein